MDDAFEPVHEEPYSPGKFCNEHTCAMFARGFGMTTAALRFAGVWNNELYDRARAVNDLQPVHLKGLDTWLRFRSRCRY